LKLWPARTMTLRLRVLSRTRTAPSRTLTRVPSHSSVVAHSVPIAAADTEPVAVRQRPPFSLTHRRLERFLRFAAAVARAALPQPVSDGSRRSVVGDAPGPI
jgi:hypothetical protein